MAFRDRFWDNLGAQELQNGAQEAPKMGPKMDQKNDQTLMRFLIDLASLGGGPNVDFTRHDRYGLHVGPFSSDLLGGARNDRKWKENDARTVPRASKIELGRPSSSGKTRICALGSTFFFPVGSSEASRGEKVRARRAVRALMPE